MLVDDEFHIARIIDWECAHTGSNSGAFNSPRGLLPVAESFAGVNSIGEGGIFLAKCFKSKEHPGVEMIVRNGRFMHRF